MLAMNKRQPTTLLRFNKPHGVLCQFRDPQRATLADFIEVPHVYPAGRLDYASEGLLLLTNSGKLQARISEPRYKLPKTYLAQVEGEPSEANLRALVDGVELRDGLSRFAAARCIDPPALPDRSPPVTPHRAARSNWVEVRLTSGRNRQVRRSLAAVGLPVLRLLRTQIGPCDLADLAPGQWQAVDAQVIAQLLGTA